MKLCHSLSLLAAVFLTGCPSPRTASFAFKPFNTAQVLGDIVQRAGSIRTMRAEGYISIETPYLVQSGSFILSIRKPDSLLIRLQGPFGIKAGWLFATADEFTFYNALENQLITGASSAKNLERILHANLSFSEVLEALCGNALTQYDGASPDEIATENDRPVLVFRDGASVRRYTLDEQLHSVVRLQFLDRNGKLAMEQTFADFQESPGTGIPLTIRILQPRERQFVSLSYSEVRVNDGSPDFSFALPAKAKRIRW